MRAQQFRDVQYQVGRGDAFVQLSAHVHAHHFGGQKVNRLTEHSGFGFNSAHAPADDAETIDHRCVRVGPDQRVGVENVAIVDLRVLHAFSEVFEIHLMNDADSRWD